MFRFENQRVDVAKPAQLMKIRAGSSSERLVDLAQTPSFRGLIMPVNTDMMPYTGQAIYMRESVAERLVQANDWLTDAGCLLQVGYGYRHPAIQAYYFERQYKQLQILYPDITSSAQLITLAHMRAAYPPVAGHPTGGAVDVTLCDAVGRPLDMGTLQNNFMQPERLPTFAPDLTARQAANRRLLLGAMMQAGFAPFFGEWWHFSYGDREWACFYGKPQALYRPVKFSIAARPSPVLAL